MLGGEDFCGKKFLPLRRGGGCQALIIVTYVRWGATILPRLDPCPAPNPRAGTPEGLAHGRVSTFKRRGGLGNANPAARDLGNYRGTGEMVPFVNRTFEWGVAIATFLSVLSVVPRHCARLAYFLHPKLREIHAVLVTPQPITLPLRRLRCAGSVALGLAILGSSVHRPAKGSCAKDTHACTHRTPLTSPPSPPLHCVWQQCLPHADGGPLVVGPPLLFLNVMPVPMRLSAAAIHRAPG